MALDNVYDTHLLSAFEVGSIDFIKVHGDIVRNLKIDASMHALCTAILKHCTHIHAKSIATHLNAKVVLEAAQQLPFDFFQGYIFEQPHTM